MPANLEDSASGHRTGRGQFSFQSQRKAMPKNAQTTAQLQLSHTPANNAQNSPARLQPYVNHEISDNQTGFRKGRGTRDQIANICWIIEKAREFQKNIYSALLTTPKPLTVCIKVKWKILKEMGNQTSWPASWETCMQVRKQQLELDMEQQTGSK